GSDTPRSPRTRALRPRTCTWSWRSARGREGRALARCPPCSGSMTGVTGPNQVPQRTRPARFIGGIMSPRHLGVFFLGLLALSPAGAQEPSKPAFDRLLERVKQSDPKVDFARLRMAFTETAAYDPYAEEDKRRKAMSEALANKEYEKAVKLAEQ